MALSPTVISQGDFPEAGRPFSIYLKLEQGAQADLEVIARSSLALISAMRDFVSFADPSVDFKVTIQNGEEGSLRLNAFIKLFMGSSDEARKKRQSALNWAIFGAVTFILEGTAGHYLEKVNDWIDTKVIEMVEAGEEPTEIEAIAAECKSIINGALNNEVTEPHLRRFYSEVRSDPNILGVGIAGDHHELPERIIPRSEFYERSQSLMPPEEESKRERVERVQVLLVQPRLLGDEKPWRFSIGGIEFSAKVRDRKFIEDTLSGKNSIPLVEGVYLDVDMRFDERKVGEAWVIKTRTIQHVRGVQSGGSQPSLLGPIE